MLSRRSLIASIAAVATVISLAMPARADTNAEARAFVQKLADTAMSTVAVKGLTEGERAQRIRTLFVENFDLPEIGKLVLGRYWHNPATTSAQQQEFLKLFEDIQVYTWTKRFRDYSGETLEIIGVAPAGETDMLLDSRIKREHLDPINVTWRLRKQTDGFRVLDINVEGASMAFTHRAEYSSVIRANGNQVEGLLAAMRTKVTQLHAETSAAAPAAVRAN